MFRVQRLQAGLDGQSNAPFLKPSTLTIIIFSTLREVKLRDEGGGS